MYKNKCGEIIKITPKITRTKNTILQIINSINLVMAMFSRVKASENTININPNYSGLGALHKERQYFHENLKNVCQWYDQNFKERIDDGCDASFIRWKTIIINGKCRAEYITKCANSRKIKLTGLFIFENFLLFDKNVKLTFLSKILYAISYILNSLFYIVFYYKINRNYFNKKKIYSRFNEKSRCVFGINFDRTINELDAALDIIKESNLSYKVFYLKRVNIKNSKHFDESMFLCVNDYVSIGKFRLYKHLIVAIFVAIQGGFSADKARNFQKISKISTNDLSIELYNFIEQFKSPDYVQVFDFWELSNTLISAFKQSGAHTVFKSYMGIDAYTDILDTKGIDSLIHCGNNYYELMKSNHKGQSVVVGNKAINYCKKINYQNLLVLTRPANEYLSNKTLAYLAILIQKLTLDNFPIPIRVREHPAYNVGLFNNHHSVIKDDFCSIDESVINADIVISVLSTSLINVMLSKKLLILIATKEEILFLDILGIKLINGINCYVIDPNQGCLINSCAIINNASCSIHSSEHRVIINKAYEDAKYFICPDNFDYRYKKFIEDTLRVV
jgi:hypothetical protein